MDSVDRTRRTRARRGADGGDRHATARGDAELLDDRRRDTRRATRVAHRRAVRRSRRQSARSAGDSASKPLSRGASRSCRRAFRAPTRRFARRPTSWSRDSTRCSASSRTHGMLLEDVDISLEPARALRFVVREELAAAGRRTSRALGPHQPLDSIPRVRDSIAMRSVESAADPAMRTLVAGRRVRAADVSRPDSGRVAFCGDRLSRCVYLVSLPIAAEINFYLERATPARDSARARVLPVSARSALQQRLADGARRVAHGRAQRSSARSGMRIGRQA